MCCLLSSMCWWLIVFGCLVAFLTVMNMTREVCGCRSGYWDSHYIGYSDLTKIYYLILLNIGHDTIKEVCIVACHLPSWMF